MTKIEKFRKIPFKTRTKCMVCEAKSTDPIIKFPNFPLTEIYVKNKVKEKVGFVNQELHLCDKDNA